MALSSLNRLIIGALMICMAAMPATVSAYPGRVDIRVAVSSPELDGQARDLEQTLLALIYSMGGRIASGQSSEAEAVTEKAKRTLEGIQQRINLRMSPNEARDLRVAVDTVEHHFREASGTIAMAQWADLVRTQATLLAMLGQVDESRKRFGFFFNLQPEIKPEHIKDGGASVKPVVKEAHLRWSQSGQGSVLLQGLPEGSRVFVDGRPVAAKKGRLSGLRVGLHLVQVLIRGEPAFGAVVDVPAQGLASVLVRSGRSSISKHQGDDEGSVMNVLLGEKKIPEPLLKAVAAKQGVDGMLFVALRAGSSKSTLLRGVWLHETHEARYFSVSFEPGASTRQALEQELKIIIEPVESP